MKFNINIWIFEDFESTWNVYGEVDARICRSHFRGIIILSGALTFSSIQQNNHKILSKNKIKKKKKIINSFTYIIYYAF